MSFRIYHKIYHKIVVFFFRLAKPPPEFRGRGFSVAGLDGNWACCSLTAGVRSGDHLPSFGLFSGWIGSIPRIMTVGVCRPFYRGQAGTLASGLVRTRRGPQVNVDLQAAERH